MAKNKIAAGIIILTLSGLLLVILIKAGFANKPKVLAQIEPSPKIINLYYTKELAGEADVVFTVPPCKVLEVGTLGVGVFGPMDLLEVKPGGLAIHKFSTAYLQVINAEIYHDTVSLNPPLIFSSKSQMVLKPWNAGLRKYQLVITGYLKASLTSDDNCTA